VGNDLVEIERIRKSMKNPRFCLRVLGGREYAQLEGRGFPAESVAASFCAKEAFSKAVGTGISGFDLREAQLLRTPSGRPELCLSGRARELAGDREFSVSVTHTREYASAVVVGEGATFPGEPEKKEIAAGLERVRTILRPRDPESNKGNYGRLLCVCGSEGMAGAAVMSTRAAVRCGAGIVEAALPKAIYPIVASQVCEPVFTLLELSGESELLPGGEEALRSALGKASAVLIGCGLGKSAAARTLVSIVLESSSVPVVLDADGINIVSENIDILKTVRVPLILTPHPGEMARLLKTDASQVQQNREMVAREFAKRRGVILVLKGAGTLVAAPDGRLFRNTTGNPGMAKGGSGDVLAGMIASFAAQGIEPFEAASGAVFLHGLAGDRCARKYSMTAMLPTDLTDTLPELFREIGR
jgi:ADP-dependent NAD(P)H-hydrate dehydratase / NAD(P)H-hydrate epimerase